MHFGWQGMSSRAERSRAEASDELLVGPIRGELLGADHLASRARAVARGQKLVVGRLPLRPARLLARLSETRRILTDARARLIAAAAADLDAGPAAEWLLDNYHVVQEHLQEVRASLPGDYYRELPELASGGLTGYPRVYEIAISLISHTEARVDLDNVDLFVESFQSVTPLSVGELWAMPAMLRIGLIESVRRMTLRTMQRLDEIELAGKWAARILSANDRGGAELRAALKDFSEADHSLTPNFVSRFLQSLRQAEGSSPPLIWLEQWMRDAGVSPENAVAHSTQRLALTQIMMANSITSLRDIGRRDWRLFVEHQSVMEAALRKDPSGFYPLMTFATRDRYRHVVERICKRTNHREASVASWAVDLARKSFEASGSTSDPRWSHVGYYLVDDGLSELERMANYKPKIGERIERWVHSHPNLIFVGGLALCTMLAIMAVLIFIEPDARASIWLVLFFAFFPALDISVIVVNQLVTTWLPPRVLSRLDLHEHGVPAEYRTAVVIPTLFGTVDDVNEALENLEVQFLANREAHLQFGILSDFTDADAEVQPTDSDIVEAAVAGIHSLNQRHSRGEADEFFLLHRSRKWNEQQGVWMGWERKRGKLFDFNLLLRDGDQGSFSVNTAEAASLRGIRYVITLDADTVLPPDAAPSLVGAMAHPLNRAVYDPDRRRIVRGYGILQPRVGISLPSAHKSRFAAIASGHPGVDPYSTAVSDVYQDLFGEGSFTGKGIYDVDAFQLATFGRFPANTLLSHDLIEGNYARAGLATDVIVYDDYPSSYVAFSRRKHRWIRGDWQLLPWLARFVPGPAGRERNRLSLLSKWKIIDNLRRSMVEIAQLLFLVAGWTVLPGSVLRWTMLGVGAVVAPWVSALALAIIRPPFDKSWRAYYAAVMGDALVSAQQAILALIFLPHQAFISADAIVRTLYRMLVSRKNLLEWQSASMVERNVANVAHATTRAMRATAFLVGVLALVISFLAINRQVELGLPLSGLARAAASMWTVVLLWVLAPWIATRLSRESAPVRRKLSSSARDTAARYASLHWHFFDRFVSEKTHWLAPDNFQSDPEPVIAMRTSPTNMGLQLLAIISAHDLSLITAADMTERLEKTFKTLISLRRYRGHFYNWYSLEDLRPLEPPYISVVDSGNIAGHLIAVRQACLQLAGEWEVLRDRLESIADQAYAFVVAMDFSFLYDESRKLFTIGYHPESFTADNSFYDLLASEARLASFIAIARNDAPVEHWFRMSRALNRTSGSTALVSWSGSMFEYLMPVLVMRAFPFTVLDQTYRGVVDRHISYARARNVPWGVSESAYNVRDRHETYQYRAFGIADLAFKRGLGRDLVIAPYATALAALVDPPRALANLRTLESMGALSEFGFCDSLDYTRPAEGHRFAMVRAYMAHHIGMTLVSMTNVLKDDIWQDRFHSDPLVKSVELLLHERIPRRLVMQDTQTAELDDARPDLKNSRPILREVNTSESNSPRVALLGSHPYTVMLNHNGSGYSRYESLAVTRWRADSTSDDTGQFCYLKDVTSGRVWSAATQPVNAPSDWSRAWLSSDRVVLHRNDGTLETRTEITVVTSDCAEVRRVTVTNTGRDTREIELTSYGEVVMASPDSDRAHPAFSNLFVETEWHEWCTAVTATRRPRKAGEERLWCVHVVDTGRDRVGDVTFETDRSRFIGRGRSVRDPIAMDTTGDLSGSVGAVLDPVFALRTRVRILPGQSASVAFTTLIAKSRAAAFELADRYHSAHAAQRALDFAWTSTQIELRELGITPASAAVFQEIATQILYRGGSMAPPLDELRRNRGSQPVLWANGISGDKPIVLATIDSIDGLPTLRELFAAHRYWRRRGLDVDLVVINAHPYDYLQELRDSITEAMVAANDATTIDQPGGVFVRRREAFTADDFLMLSATARVHVRCDGRPLTRVLAGAEPRAKEGEAENGVVTPARGSDRITPAYVATTEKAGPIASIVSALRPLVTPLLPRTTRARVRSADGLSPAEPLQFNNGIGGFDENGDYLIDVQASNLPPAPWVNVIANQQGGFIVSERGSGCTWAENAYFYRLTPWHNDPVSDPSSDAIYIKDLDSGALWSATPAPVRAEVGYRVRHSPGCSVFESDHDGIHSELLVGMADEAALKLSLLRLTNNSDAARKLSLTAYVEWTLGARREDTQYQVRTRFSAAQNALFAQNHFDPHFTDWVSFLACSEPLSSFSADRLSFLGRNGSTQLPDALSGDALDGAAGVGLDPCAALQLTVVLAPGETREITFMLGAADTETDANRLLERVRTSASVRTTLTNSINGWANRLAVVSVRSPEPAFDVIINKWALYQALSSRMWARTALYQSSGAYGFRDQLQDVMAFVYAEPGVAREHILRASSRQFLDGDVQHWWHPHTGRGVRTKFSDDLVWLPFAVDHYIQVTGDHSVLEEYVPFLTMRELEPDEHEVYDLPSVTDEHGSVYEHCRRALRRACTIGAHGLPLIGAGDWNDGMNRVGIEGQGESVWLAWFLVKTLRSFAVYASRRGDEAEADFMHTAADTYTASVEANAWDGQWYRRAYYDDGAPMGSATSDDCKIDSIAQSWSVISGGGSSARQGLAMRALNSNLVREDARLIMLLTPPFDRGEHDPGYIKGYLPGVRENGAQYTHAALWAVLATAMRGNGDRAFDLYQMINPVTHGSTPEGMSEYKVEPYVIAADVYTAPTQLGRGGWTWYTGSASWMYRVGLEHLLGFTKRGNTLTFDPRVPQSWDQFEISYRFGRTVYEIAVRDPAGVQRQGAEIFIDGERIEGDELELVDDGINRKVVFAPASVSYQRA